MNFFNVISAYLIPLAGLLFLLGLIILNPLFDKRQTRLFIIAVAVNIVLMVTTSIDYLIVVDRLKDLWMVRRFTSFLNFSASPLVPLLLLKILDQRKLSWRAIPFVLNLLICFSSVFVNTVFFIPVSNGYERGPLFFLPFVTSIIYIVMLILKPVDSHRQNKKNERIFLLAIIVLLALGMFLEIVCGFNLLTWGCSALSLILYYLLLNIHYYIIDPLTGVYNRIMYNKALADIDRSRPCMLVAIDLNEFKAVNDTYGHSAGDKCLMDFVKRLNSHIGHLSVVYRIGGDEFALLSNSSDYARMESTLQAARADIQKDVIDFAYGMVQYHPSDDLNQALKQVDTIMYKNKQASRRANEEGPQGAGERCEEI